MWQDPIRSTQSDKLSHACPSSERVTLWLRTMPSRLSGAGAACEYSLGSGSGTDGPAGSGRRALGPEEAGGRSHVCPEWTGTGTCREEPTSGHARGGVVGHGAQAEGMWDTEESHEAEEQAGAEGRSVQRLLRCRA